MFSAALPCASPRLLKLSTGSDYLVTVASTLTTVSFCRFPLSSTRRRVSDSPLTSTDTADYSRCPTPSSFSRCTCPNAIPRCLMFQDHHACLNLSEAIVCHSVMQQLSATELSPLLLSPLSDLCVPLTTRMFHAGPQFVLRYPLRRIVAILSGLASPSWGHGLSHHVNPLLRRSRAR